MGTKGFRKGCWVWLLVLLSWLVFLGNAEAALDCSGCHGTSADIRPQDASLRNISSGGFVGNHRTHLPLGVTSVSCSVCHPGAGGYSASHRDGVITLLPKLNNSPDRTRYGAYSTSFPQTATPTPSTCSGVNCHFEKETPIWGSATLARNDCTACHGSPPSDGAHAPHVTAVGGGTNSCGKCHIDHPAEADPLSHARQAGSRSLAVQFTTFPNNGGNYSGDVSYPNYLPSKSPSRNGTCTGLYCHSDGRNGLPTRQVTWNATGPAACYWCHRGRTADNNEQACAEINGVWDSTKNLCAPYVNMTSNGHSRLVGPQWIRKYPCYFCHNATMNSDGSIKDHSRHVNKVKDVEMASQWAIVGRPAPSYNAVSKNCDNVYCHSDGTTDPEEVRPFSWNSKGTECNTCHGHPTQGCSQQGCHDGVTVHNGRVLPIFTKWTAGQEWKASMPMFENKGAGSARANSHPRHAQTNFTCDNCHAATIKNGSCTSCHRNGIPPGSMKESAHLDPAFHVNKAKDVVFLDGGTYNPIGKSCSTTKCHNGGIDPVWGGSVNTTVICLSCHGITGPDQDDYDAFNGLQARVNLTEWATYGHGRPASAGNYPSSGNPAAGFPGNPCWYCHDSNILHNDKSNPFRLRLHSQFYQRFEKECLYCHMERTADARECISCHVGQAESLAPQATASGIVFKLQGGATEIRYPGHGYLTNCITSGCHDADAGTFPSGAHKGHSVDAGIWTNEQKNDVRNQYVMMGVCLQCHDDDSGGKCTQCHTPPVNNPAKYSLGFDPGTGFIKPTRARASSVHFGFKHYQAFTSTGGWTKDANGRPIGVWKGGKFCWDCHDPHGDKNIYMIHAKVATSTEGTFGRPLTRADVVFTRKQTGDDYARDKEPYNGICNVCHSSGSQHYRKDGGDGHNSSRICTTCHEHRFTDSHADKQDCSDCHNAKPVPRHSGFGLPRDCTKCHAGTINKRMDIMGQMNANSHHVQGVSVTNKHCYACHWEATPEGLIDNRYHEGYNYKTYATVKNAKVDLVVWQPGTRPTFYSMTSVVTFLAANIGTANERAEVGRLNNHCISCHSDQNNDTTPFNDCKTPRYYAWDRQSIASRYASKGVATWGKYSTLTGGGKKRVQKALSAHGNAIANQGGWDPQTGIDGILPNTRNGSQNVQCYDCHSSHGSKVVGITSSYRTVNGSFNGGNLKETQAGKGGYSVTYKASANSNQSSSNPYNAGAGQCFDCHENRNAGTMPWGYQSTFGATEPIMGYKDTMRFGPGTKGSTSRFGYRASRSAIVSSHLKAGAFLNYTTDGKINGLCTPCHDPHGVSRTLGENMAYAVPLLKGTWMTSPYKEDTPPPNPPDNQYAPKDGNGRTIAWSNNGAHPAVQPTSNHYVDRNTFGGNTRISENDDKFAGLCIGCHRKDKFTNGTRTQWKETDRIHRAVKGWGVNGVNKEHSFTCSKCHQPHNSGLPRLMQTNCLDYKHRGSVVSGGTPWAADKTSPWNADSHWEHRGYPVASIYNNSNANEAIIGCHVSRFGKPYPTQPTQVPAEWPAENLWNTVTPW